MMYDNVWQWWLSKLSTHGSIWIYIEQGLLTQIKLKGNK